MRKVTRTFSIWLEMLNTRHCLNSCWTVATIMSTWYNNVNLHISIFEWEGYKFIRCKVLPVKHILLAFTWIKACKRPEVKSELLHFLTFMNNNKGFLSSGGIQLPVFWAASASTRTLASQKGIGFLETSKTRLIKRQRQ